MTKSTARAIRRKAFFSPRQKKMSRQANSFGRPIGKTPCTRSLKRWTNLWYKNHKDNPINRQFLYGANAKEHRRAISGRVLIRAVRRMKIEQTRHEMFLRRSGLI
jgi:hypothetical protein